MGYTKLNLVAPIYELQEKETIRQHYFFNLFCESDMQLSEFIRSFNELKKGCIWKGNRKEIELDFNPPKPKTFEQWHLHNQWKTRKREYWKCKLNGIRDELQKELIAFFKEDSAKLRQSSKKDWVLDKQIDYDDRTPAHLKSKGKNELASAHQKKIDTLLIQSGMPKDIAQTEVNMNAEVSAEVEVSSDAKLDEMKELADRMEKMEYD